MMSFEEFLPVLRNIELFRDFAEESDENRRSLVLVYQNMSVKNFKKVKCWRSGCLFPEFF